MNPTTVSRLKLLLLAALFFGPMIVACVVYFGPAQWKPQHSTAAGHLVDPAQPLPAIQFHAADGAPVELTELWTILHVGRGVCAADCKQRLWQTRQLRTLLHRRRGRVQRAYLMEDSAQIVALAEELAPEHPRLLVLSLSPEDQATFQHWLGQLPVADPVLLIDPLGNWLMYYGDELPLKGMFSDIKRVLKLSNIG